MPTPQEVEQAISRVHDQSSFIQDLLIDALGWDIPEEITKIEDISYGWSADELRAEGLGRHVVDGRIFQVQPVRASQPWGVFLLEFRSDAAFTTGRGMTGPLRKVLRGLVPKARGRASHLPAWDRQDLLFICTHDYKHFRFAYFKEPSEGTKTAPLATFGWGPDIPARTVCTFNLPALEWPEPGVSRDDWNAGWRSAFDVEKVTRKFYEDYREVFEKIEELIAKQGDLKAHEESRMFAQTLFNRLMFLRFVERKGWLSYQGHKDYLRALHEAGGIGKKSLYQSRIRPLFFKGLAEEGFEDAEAIGKVPFLNGGLFEKVPLDDKVKDIPDEALAPVIGRDGLFYRYNFTIEESTPLDIEVAVDPEMLGKVFEELVTGRHETGSYYTPRPIVAFMCHEALKGYLAERTKAKPEAVAALVDEHEVREVSVSDARQILEALDDLKAVDPACGSGAYLLGLLQELVSIYRLLYSEKLTKDSFSLFELKQRIICNNLYGVDIDSFATNIAMLRLWLSLVVEFDGFDPPPLPNLDFKIETGDSLTVPCEIVQGRMDLHMLRERADSLVLEKKKFLTSHGPEKEDARKRILRAELEIAKDVYGLHGEGAIEWRVQFAEIFAHGRGGFDVVLANPPYVNMVQMDALDPEYRERLRALFLTARRGFDLFVPFMERGLQLTAPGGMFVYIVPNKLLSAEYSARLRDYITREATLLSLVDLSQVPVFSAAVYPVIVLAQNRKCDPNTARVCVYCADATSLDNVALIKIGDTPLATATRAKGRWSPLLDKTTGTDVGVIIARCKTLEEIADVSGACTVSEAYDWKAAVIDEGQRLHASHPERYAPFVVSGNVRRFYHTWEEYSVQYIKKSYRMPVLDKKHPVVSSRRVHQVESHKIIISGMSKRPTCVWDLGGIAAGKSTVIVIPKSKRDGQFLTAVINSNAMSNIYKALFGSLSLSGGYLRFGPPQVKALPIPEASAEERARIAALAQKCGDARGIGSEKWEKQIDEHVAALYGLDCLKSAGSPAPKPAPGATKKAAPAPAGTGPEFKLSSPVKAATGRLKLKPAARPARKPEAQPASINDFDRDQLKEALLGVVGTDWIERDDAFRAAAERLGFKRLGKNIRAAFQSAITGLLRQNRLESAGSRIRKAR